jgi:hypothetical protein
LLKFLFLAVSPVLWRQMPSKDIFGVPFSPILLRKISENGTPKIFILPPAAAEYFLRNLMVVEQPPRLYIPKIKKPVTTYDVATGYSTFR